MSSPGRTAASFIGPKWIGLWCSHCSGALALGGILASTPVAAQPQAARPHPVAMPGQAAQPWEPRRLGSGAHWIAGIGIGKSLRFNNPFRLARPLGKSAESVSLAPLYLDLQLGAVRGAPKGYQQGAVIHLSVAMEGIGQEVLSPAYLGLLRLSPRWLALGRIGTPIVLRPALTWGIESALGVAGLATAGLGWEAEIVGSVFYGAATTERAATAIPMLAIQWSAFVDWEALP